MPSLLAPLSFPFPPLFLPFERLAFAAPALSFAALALSFAAFSLSFAALAFSFSSAVERDREAGPAFPTPNERFDFALVAHLNHCVGGAVRLDLRFLESLCGSVNSGARPSFVRL